MKEWSLPPHQFSFRRAGPSAKLWANLIPSPNHLVGTKGCQKLSTTFLTLYKGLKCTHYWGIVSKICPQVQLRVPYSTYPRFLNTLPLGHPVNHQVLIAQTSEKLANFCSDGILGTLNFESKICREVQKYVTQMHLFGLTVFWLMADWVIFDIGWVVAKAHFYTMKGQW